MDALGAEAMEAEDRRDSTDDGESMSTVSSLTMPSGVEEWLEHEEANLGPHPRSL